MATGRTDVRPPRPASPGHRPSRRDRRRLLPALLGAVLLAALAPATGHAAAPGPSTTTAPAPSAAAAAAPTTELGDFETGTDPWEVSVSGGTTATLTGSTDAPASGAALARFTVTPGTGPAEMVRGTGDLDLTALDLQLRSTTVGEVVLRLTDSTDQVHQQVLTIAADGSWQPVTVTTFAGGQGYIHFGGADDGVWHPPLRRMSLLVDTFRIQGGGQGVLDVDRVTATVTPPPLSVSTTTTGNVFRTGDTVSFGVSTQARQLQWTARDARGAVAAQGSSAVADLGGTVTLGALPVGWYGVDLVGTRADGSTVTGGTDIAVLPQGDVRERRIGASTHYGQSWSTATIDLLADAGLGFARDEAYWAQQETTKGSIVFTPKVEAYASALQAADVQFLDILAYGNPLYHEGEAPATDAGRQGFAQYGLASVDRFGTDDAVYEVWNEWNIRDTGGPAGATAANYVALLRTTEQTIRAAHPDATIVGPALAPINDWQQWVDDFIAAGGLDHIDAFSTHPYNFTESPEVVRSHLDWLRQRFAAAGHPDMPIWITEQGWHTSTSSVGVGEPAQARDLVRAALTSLTDGVQRFTIYDLQDDGTDPAEPEHRFGIIRNPDDPRGAFVTKPAYVAQATLTRAIAGRPVLTSADPGDDRHVATFGPRSGEDGAVRMQALWADTAQTVTVATSSPVVLTDTWGAATTLQPAADGTVTVTIGPDPVYLVGELGALTAGGGSSLVAGDGVTDEAVPATWTVHNPGTTAHRYTLTVAGSTIGTLTVAGGATGTATVPLPATAAAGDRSWAAQLRQDGVVVGVLTAATTVRAALSLDGRHALTAAGGSVLRLTVTNNGASARTLERLGWSVGGTTGKQLAGTTLAAGATRVVDVPVTLQGSTPWTAELVAGRTTTASGTLVAADPIGVPFRTVTVDGTPDAAVTASPGVDLTAQAPPITGWAGPSDLSGTLWLTHDAGTLYLTAVITDDVQSQPARAGSMWQGDGVQLGLSSGWPGEAQATSEIGAALTDAGPVDVFRWLPAGASTTGVRAAVTRDAAAHRTRYEIAVPLSAISVDPADGLLSATVAVNENDGTGRRGWASWGQGVAESKDPAKFQPLRLLPPQPGTTVALRTSARAQCWPSGAVVAVHAVNLETVPVDIRLATPWGEKKYSRVAPGAAVYAAFATGSSTAPASTATVAGYLVRGGVPSYQRRTLPTAAVSCS